LSIPTTGADDRAAACGHCGAALLAPAWRELPLVEQVTQGRVRTLVTRWPDGTGIEVRRCRCGHPLARKVVDST
jgi:hypothetical protein